MKQIEQNQVNVLLIGYDGLIERLVTQCFSEQYSAGELVTKLPMTFDHAQSEAESRQALKKTNYDLVITVGERYGPMPEGPCDCNGHALFPPLDVKLVDPKELNGYQVGFIAKELGKIKGRKPYVILYAQQPDQRKAVLLDVDEVVGSVGSLETAVKNQAELYKRTRTEKNMVERVGL
jgi:hypothetical protein